MSVQLEDFRMAAKKKTVKKKTTAKKATKKKATRKKARTARQLFEDNLRSLEKQLPPKAARRVNELRKTVKDLERQIDKARKDAEARLHKAELQIRKDAVKVLRRIERAIEPPKRKAAKKKASKK